MMPKLKEKASYIISPESCLNIKDKILIDLGKATRRGVKRCFKCGVLNGTKGTLCKNKQCDAVFKDLPNKRNVSLDAVQLITGNLRRVYSVQVGDEGAYHRGFVQLPLMQTRNEDSNVSTDVGLCFVNTCQRLFHDSILKCHENEDNDNPEETNSACIHITSALKSRNVAIPLDFKRGALDKLNISEEIKQRLWFYAKETNIHVPIVQRVSKHIMAIKCQVTPKHPLGYLHFIIRNNRRDAHEKYFCNCSETVFSGITNLNNKLGRCIHYFVCIGALASDPKCAKEFHSFISLESFSSESPNHLENNSQLMLNIKSLKEPKIQKLQATGAKSLGVFEKNVLERKERRTTKTLKKTRKNLLRSTKLRKLCPKIFPIEIKILNDHVNEFNNNITDKEENVTWTFTDWLSYVTESINKTMVFENCGILNNLLFHIPKKFYEVLRKRIPSIYLGSPIEHNFNYEVIYIMNIGHLKHIFNTVKIKLNVSKRFVSTDGVAYVDFNDNEEYNTNYMKSFIYFLNVGQLTVDESDNTNNSFLVEWIPNVTNVSSVGQLKLQFKYGRKSI